LTLFAGVLLALLNVTHDGNQAGGGGDTLLVRAGNQLVAFVGTPALPPPPTPGWSSWESLGGKLASGPAATTWGPGRLDAFVRGTDSLVWDRWYDNGTWYWTNLGGYTTGDPAPAASLLAPGSIAVAEADFGRTLSVDTYNGSWRGWVHCIGGVLAAEPSAVFASPTSQDVYVEGTDRQLWHWFNNGPGVCGGWQPIGGVLSSAPAAVHGGSGEDVVFVRGADLGLWYWSSLTGWHAAGGKIAGKPAALSAGNGPPDAFVQGLDGALWRYATTTGTWQDIGGRIIGPPSAVASAGALPLDVFVEGVDHAVWHASSSNGSSWQWEALGGSISGPPSAVSWAGGRFDLFARMTDGALWHRFYQ